VWKAKVIPDIQLQLVEPSSHVVSACLRRFDHSVTDGLADLFSKFA
jgi:hypothetical protein